jgi:F-box/leucine-rich repeat protein 2/20
MTLDCTPGSGNGRVRRHALRRRHWLIIMSTPPDIDNDDTLFQFDPYDALASRAPPFRIQLKPESEFIAQDIAPPMSSHDESTTSGKLDLGLEILVQPTITKGKQRTEPMPIRPSSIVYDLFDSSPSVVSTSSSRVYASSSSSTAFSPSSFSFSSPKFDGGRYRQHSPSVESMEQLEASDIESSSLDSPPSSKGKERESFPFLPPLTFSLIQLNPDRGLLPAPSQLPYDRNDRHSPLPRSANQVLPILSPTESSSLERNLPEFQEVTKHPVSRSQSFSNLAQQIPVPPGTSLDRPSTVGPSRTPSNLSLIFDKRVNDPLNSKSSDKPIEPAAPISTPVTTDVELGDGYATAWYTVSRPYGLPVVQTQPPAIPSLPEHLRLDSSTRMLLKGQSRFTSSPHLLSALDFVPITSTDIFQSFPIVIQNYFDLSLPKELRLQIFRDLVHVHERDHMRLFSSGRFTATKASYSRNRWVGRDRGIRELFKLSRVCFRGYYLDI